MARRDDGGNDENRGAKARAAVSRASHPAAGGHPSGSHPSVRAPTRGLMRNQIYSPSARRQWDADDAATGGDGPYQYVEYPKHVVIDGVTHVAQSAEHEQAIRNT